MKIVILGWGSLIWNPDGLPMRGSWRKHGPVLPIEFSRISSDGRLTLVIDEGNGVDVPTQYVLSPRTKLTDAIEDLRKREKTSRDRIGFVDVLRNCKVTDIDPTQAHSVERIEVWANQKQVDAVVWTALASNFAEKQGKQFSVQDAINYLEGLSGNTQELAIEYLRRAPVEVETPLRRRLRDVRMI